MDAHPSAAWDKPSDNEAVKVGNESNDAYPLNSILKLNDEGQLLDPEWVATEAKRVGFAMPTEEANQAPPTHLYASMKERYTIAEEYIKFEFDPEEREVEDSDLRMVLYDKTYRVNQGAFIHNIEGIPIKQSFAAGPAITPIENFEEANLHEIVSKNIKYGCEYALPSQVQTIALPAILNGEEDCLFVSQPGTGKTAAFVVPIMSSLLKDEQENSKIQAHRAEAKIERDAGRLQGLTATPRVLIVAATHELAFQVFDEVRRMAYGSLIRPCVLIGGEAYPNQRADLIKGCDILIATVGRLLDFLRRMKNVINFTYLQTVVLDEADDLILNDEKGDLSSLIADWVMQQSGEVIPRVLLFSATFPKEAREAARTMTNGPLRQIQIGTIGTIHSNIYQYVVWVEEHDKMKTLINLLLSKVVCRTIIFVNTQVKCNEVEAGLWRRGLPCASISGERSQRERIEAMTAFRSGNLPLMVTTPAGERGLDVPNVLHVIHYELPTSFYDGVDPLAKYVHRCGRTGRMGNQGQSTAFYNSRDDHMAEKLVKCLILNNQAVPDFLQQYTPQEHDVVWDDDSDEEDIAKRPLTRDARAVLPPGMEEDDLIRDIENYMTMADQEDDEDLLGLNGPPAKETFEKPIGGFDGSSDEEDTNSSGEESRTSAPSSPPTPAADANLSQSAGPSQPPSVISYGNLPASEQISNVGIVRSNQSARLSHLLPVPPVIPYGNLPASDQFANFGIDRSRQSVWSHLSPVPPVISYGNLPASEQLANVGIQRDIESRMNAQEGLTQTQIDQGRLREIKDKVDAAMGELKIALQRFANDVESCNSEAKNIYAAMPSLPPTQRWCGIWEGVFVPDAVHASLKKLKLAAFYQSMVWTPLFRQSAIGHDREDTEGVLRKLREGLDEEEGYHNPQSQNHENHDLA